MSKNTIEEGKTFDESYVKSLRNESAKYRTERNDYKEKYEALEAKFNNSVKLEGIIKTHFGDSNPEEAIGQLKAENFSLKMQNVFDKVSSKHGADKELTYAWLKSKGKLDNIQPDEETISSLVESTIKENPKLKIKIPKIGDDGDGIEEQKFDFNTFIRSKGKK